MRYRLYRAQNGVEYAVYPNRDEVRPRTLDLYMRRFYGKRIQAFHAMLTPDEADELAKDLMAMAMRLRATADLEKEGEPHA